jgi:hypothetical protein
LQWKEAHPDDRKTNFLPQKYSALRLTPAYPPLMRERFERCLDLYRKTLAASIATNFTHFSSMLMLHCSCTPRREKTHARGPHGPSAAGALQHQLAVYSP